LGPSGGRPREVGALIAGADLSAVDVVACHMIGLDPRMVPTIQAADEVGFGATSLDQINTVGDSLQAMRVPDFEKVREVVSVLRILPLPASVLRWMRRQWQPRPRIVADACIRCGACSAGCPIDPAAIDPLTEAERKVDDSACIRCYCCHEFCPERAIELKPGRFAWMFRPLDRL
ncbi:MAG: iron-sulfur protein, partial [bacterium]|nr:iron-sulfur protein [bacterium]